LSIVSDTSAIDKGFLEELPAKIISSRDVPRISRKLCSPKINLIASIIFDFPHPFGPTIAAIDGGGSNKKVVLSAKDLKPLSVNSLRCNFVS